MTPPTLSIQERAAGLAAALHYFGRERPDQVVGTARSLLANYGYQRDRLARIADGTATDADRMTYPDDSYIERDHGYVLRFMGVRRFTLVRDIDESGVSGTGEVAEGVVFDDDRAGMTWLTDSRSIAFYPSIQVLERIHGHGGKTRVVFDDAAPEPAAAA